MDLDGFLKRRIFPREYSIPINRLQAASCMNLPTERITLFNILTNSIYSVIHENELIKRRIHLIPLFERIESECYKNGVPESVIRSYNISRGSPITDGDSIMEIKKAITSPSLYHLTKNKFLDTPTSLLIVSGMIDFVEEGYPFDYNQIEDFVEKERRELERNLRDFRASSLPGLINSARLLLSKMDTYIM